MATPQQLASFNYSVPSPLAWNPVQTRNFTAVAGNAYPVDTTSGAVTVTFPASPTAGQIVQITDYAGTFNTNACTINRNGSNIGGFASNFILNLSRESLSFVYIDAAQGWIQYSGLTTNTFSYTVEYLIVAGGGAGGSLINEGVGCGGGGAGGYISGSKIISGGSTFTITIGGGGAGSISVASTSGTSSSANFNGTETAVGGGRGSGQTGAGTANTYAAASGGSGGGGGWGQPTGAAGTSGQGFSGGNAQSPNNYPGGGGGGATAAGGSPASSTSNGGAGGAGINWLSIGTSYCGGGGGGSRGTGTGGAGGAGGGGAGGTNAAGTNGTANTGGGGGGAAFSSVTNLLGGNGGSGVFILRYSGSQRGSGGTVTSAGGYTYHTFTTSGIYTA